MIQHVVEIDESRIDHIFRDAPGHLPDTFMNRQLLVNTASNEANLLGVDRYGNEWYGQVRPDGAQTWAKVRRGTIVNGGVNLEPQAFNRKTGLSGRSKP